MTAAALRFPPDRPPLQTIWRAVFWAPSRLYGAAAGLRRAAYSRGYLETVRLPVPVFCVGGLSAGGAGKTPGVVWLAERLRAKGRRPAVVTRGYGRRSEDALTVVGDGERVLSDARAAGDEPLLMARRLPGVPVLAAADRALAARHACEAFGADCVVMDDGYQHFRLYRDLNLLCLDALEPLGGPLLPAGPWRENLEGLGRAGIIFLTKSNLCPKERLDALTEEVSRLAPGTPCVPVRYELSFFEGTVEISRERMKDRPLLALSALAKPESFEAALGNLGADVAPCRFPDHHFFSDRDLRGARRRAEAEGRAVVVTEKDFQKLPPDFPCVTARLRWIPDASDDRWPIRIDSIIS
ncbi:MAG: tetraacyldisaccharide 4'-kinase [Elusimicrobiota bacterium]